MTELYDKQNYSSKTLETYEILAAYFVDIFYNHLYNEAKKLKINKSCASITEGYKHSLNAFIKGLNNAKLYKKYIIGIHHYYIAVGFASISFSKCVDRVTQEFIPIDYFNSLSSTQKMGVLRLILNSSLKQFITIIVKEHLKKIIDFHNEKDNARLLQDALINCFMLERESMYQRFMSSYNDNTGINTKLINNMQNDIKKLVKEKVVLKKKYDHLIKLYFVKKKDEEKHKEHIMELLNKLKVNEIRENKIKKVNEIREIREIHENNEEDVSLNNTPKDQNLKESNTHSNTDKYIEINSNNISNLINSNNLDTINNYVMESETTLNDYLQ